MSLICLHYHSEGVYYIPLSGTCIFLIDSVFDASWSLWVFFCMCLLQFMASSQNQARYWARSFLGWTAFSRHSPNAAHEGLARLVSRGWVSGIITQNVDRLHHRAAEAHRNTISSDDKIVELHGTTHRWLILILIIIVINHIKWSYQSAFCHIYDV